MSDRKRAKPGPSTASAAAGTVELSLFPVYQDHADKDAAWVERRLQEMAIQSPKMSEGGPKVTFPTKLHELLESVEQSRQTSSAPVAIGWLRHGRAFKIYNKELFVQQVLPLVFQEQKEYSSFQRQLNLYSFVRLTGQGPDQNAYYHEFFLRNRPHLCCLITCSRIAVNSKRRSFDSLSEPNFHRMPFLDRAAMPPVPSSAPAVVTTASAPNLFAQLAAGMINPSSATIPSMTTVPSNPVSATLPVTQPAGSNLSSTLLSGLPGWPNGLDWLGVAASNVGHSASPNLAATVPATMTTAVPPLAALPTVLPTVPVAAPTSALLSNEVLRALSSPEYGSQAALALLQNSMPLSTHVPLSGGSSSSSGSAGSSTPFQSLVQQPLQQQQPHLSLIQPQPPQQPLLYPLASLPQPATANVAPAAATAAATTADVAAAVRLLHDVARSISRHVDLAVPANVSLLQNALLQQYPNGVNNNTNNALPIPPHFILPNTASLAVAAVPPPPTVAHHHHPMPAVPQQQQQQQQPPLLFAAPTVPEEVDATATALMTMATTQAARPLPPQPQPFAVSAPSSKATSSDGGAGGGDFDKTSEGESGQSSSSSLSDTGSGSGGDHGDDEAAATPEETSSGDSRASRRRHNKKRRRGDERDKTSPDEAPSSGDSQSVKGRERTSDRNSSGQRQGKIKRTKYAGGTVNNNAGTSSSGASSSGGTARFLQDVNFETSSSSGSKKASSKKKRRHKPVAAAEQQGQPPSSRR